ncbi:MAG: hypothetical protein M3O87_04225 [Candidatus Dormibacteraeota bacterium]|nr:hypothetical protein [Candidatus Dormibacteraeota bacterium]
MKAILAWLGRGRLLELVAPAVVLLAAASAAFAVFQTVHPDISQCAACDGNEYLKMVDGSPVPSPRGRRILLPILIGLLHLDHDGQVTAFLVVNMAAILLVAVGTGAIVWIASRRAGIEPRRAATAAIVAGAVFLVLPMGLRWTWYYPVLVDPFAIALVIGWLLLSISRSSSLRWAGVAVAAAAVLAREPAIIVLPAAALTQLYYSRDRRAQLPLAAATILAVALGAVVTSLVPVTGDLRGNPLVFAASWGVIRIIDPAFRGDLAWSLLVGFGFLPLLWLRRPRSLQAVIEADVSNGPPLLMPLVTLLVVGTLVSIVGGAETQRYLLAASPFALALVMIHVAQNPALDIELAVLLAASFLAWQPFTSLLDPAQADQFFAGIYYVLRHAGDAAHWLTDGLWIALPLLVGWLVVAVGGAAIARMQRRRPAAQA